MPSALYYASTQQGRWLIVCSAGGRWLGFGGLA